MTPAAYTRSAAQAVRRLGELLAEAGYRVEPLAEGHALLATKRGHSFGPFLPWSDFIFVRDLDARPAIDGDGLERLHQETRTYGESQMKVPRPLRYRVPNSVTVGVSSRGFSPDVIAVARRSRHAVNSGEKNAVYLLDLRDGALYSQGVERDPLKYAGSWVTTVNPSNRVLALLARLAGEIVPPAGAADAAAGHPLGDPGPGGDDAR